ncbi:hypothetical protein PV325_008818 [Microctonus aethiopoides]|nr:hypothetical protein PV325_008818 [Microctonus aethiopoides]
MNSLGFRIKPHSTGTNMNKMKSRRTRLSRNLTVQSSSLADRFQQLTDMAMKRPVFKFNGGKFKEFVKVVPRNYSFIVMFTAMAPQRQCQICRHASDEFVIVANSFRYSQFYSNKLFFATVDFDEGSDVFQMMRLNTAPVFIHFPAKGKPKSADTMDIQRVGFGAEAIAKWISERTDIQISQEDYSEKLIPFKKI